MGTQALAISPCMQLCLPRRPNPGPNRSLSQITGGPAGAFALPNVPGPLQRLSGGKSGSGHLWLRAPEMVGRFSQRRQCPYRKTTGKSRPGQGDAQCPRPGFFRTMWEKYGVQWLDYFFVCSPRVAGAATVAAARQVVPSPSFGK